MVCAAFRVVGSGFFFEYLSMKNEPTGLDWAILAALGLMWGSAFYLIKKSVEVYDPVQMTLLRMAMSSAIYLPVFAFFFKKIDWTKWRALVTVAVCGYGLPNYLFAVAEQNDRVSSGIAGVLNSMVPLFSLAVGAFFFGLKPSKTKVFGIFLGLFGAILLVFMSRDSGGAQPFYAFLCLVAASMYAVNANTIGAHLRGFHPLAVGAAAFAIMAVPYFFGAWRTGAVEMAFDPKNRDATLAVVYLAVVSTFIASAVYTWLVQRTNPIFATSVAYLFPVFSLSIASQTGETVGWMQIFGAAIILGGLYLSRK